MKKILFSLVLVLVGLVLVSGSASARGMRGPREGHTVMHGYVLQALADELDLSLEEVQEQYDSGLSFGQIALDNGIAEADLATFMQKVHETALSAAVEAGVITQEQADAMLQRLASRGFGTRTCPMGGTRPQDGSGFRFGDGHGMRLWGFQGQTNP